jgi:glycosyl transferase family 25
MKKKLAIIFILVCVLLIYRYDIYYLFHQEKSFTLPLKTYVINLDRTPERYKKIDESLNKYKIPHQRFSAVDGYKLNLKNLKTGEMFTGAELKEDYKKINFESKYTISCPAGDLTYIPKAIRLHATKYMTAGEFGVYCSHVGVWKEILDNKLPYALIFEDDAELRHDFAKDLESVLQNLPEDWDIVYLYIEGQKTFLRYNQYLAKLDDDGNGTASQAATLVSYKGAEKALEYIKAFRIPIDNELSEAVNEKMISAYITTPLLANAPMISILSSNPSVSSIYDMGRVYK